VQAVSAGGSHPRRGAAGRWAVATLAGLVVTAGALLLLGPHLEPPPTATGSAATPTLQLVGSRVFESGGKKRLAITGEVSPEPVDPEAVAWRVLGMVRGGIGPEVVSVGVALQTRAGPLATGSGFVFVRDSSGGWRRAASRGEVADHLAATGGR
jgi:hypothetical protein